MAGIRTATFILIFTQLCHNDGVRAAGEKFVSLFCGNFVFFKSIGEKICILFTKWGKNWHFPPFFSSPFNHIFSPKMLFGHIFAPHPTPPPGGGVKQKKIHPWINWKTTN